MKTVTVHLFTASQGIIHSDVINTYQKGSMFCVMTFGQTVYKYPVKHIFRVVEQG